MPPAGFKRSRSLWQREDESSRYYISSAFRNALLYELQPVRWNEWTSQQDMMMENGRWCFKMTAKLLQKVPAFARMVGKWLRGRTVRQWGITMAALAYYGAVRYIHYKLEAGPIVMILSALVAIFTIGLSDSANDGLPSAYSIFNRGFTSLMGSVDADALVQQHIGGGLMGAAAGAIAPPLEQPRHIEEDVVEHQNDENQDIHNEGNDPARVARRPRKKQGRRRNGEQRREIQRQREAAAEFGFGGVDENVAMNRLVEDQM